MPKKTTVLIVILALVTAVLLYLAVATEDRKQSQNGPIVQPTKKVVQKTAVLFFSPQNIDLSVPSATPSSSVDLMVDTGTRQIAGIQAELSFDPKSLSNVSLKPTIDQTGFFGTEAIVLFNDVDRQTGRVSYAIAIKPGSAARKGVGKIATLTFQKASGAILPSTTISFTNKSLVTALNETDSILKETMPLNITLSSQTITAPFIPPTTIPTSGY